MLRKKIDVKPNQQGFLYKDNQLFKQLNSGIYRFFDWNNALTIVLIPTYVNTTIITNQEVLTKDNIALRFSYMVQYQIENPKLFVEQMDVFGLNFNAFSQANLLVHLYTQAPVRDQIAAISSEELNTKRGNLFGAITEDLANSLASYGIVVKQQLLKDITFPKSIQNLFAKRLEAQVRAQTDLENAKTTVATARTLKNASTLLQGDDNIKFFQLLETMTKMSAKGNHTFVLSDFIKNVK